jgi:hypothetical protein
MEIPVQLRSKIINENNSRQRNDFKNISKRTSDYDDFLDSESEDFGNKRVDNDKAGLNEEGVYGSKGFFFQQRKGRLNVRSLAKIDLERMIRDVDIDLLQQHVENITFCRLNEDDLHYLTDPQILKLFSLAQLIIEYLLYSQDNLVSNLNQLSKKYNSKKRLISIFAAYKLV